LAKIPFQLHPFFLLLATLAAFVAFQFKSNFWLAKTMVRILSAPFITPVVFRDFYVADQLISISIVLYDLEYTFCFFLYDAWTGTDACAAANPVLRPLIAVLPGLWRFLQCLRRYKDSREYAHLLNAAKYSCSFFVAICSAIRGASIGQEQNELVFVLWLFGIVVSTIYSSYWDIVRDWGLGDRQHGFLRKKLLYKDPWVYYVAIVVNIFLRLMWTLTISPQSLGIVMDPLGFAAILAVLEIFRRGMWNLFRLQLNNVGRFRAVNVFVPPTDQDKLDNETVDAETSKFLLQAKEKHLQRHSNSPEEKVDMVPLEEISVVSS